jgi:cation:H+ antiporter
VISYGALLAGVTLAALGGELFVRGLLGFARWLRVHPGVVAATLAAFATSAPELSVGINAALAGTPQIALGDSLGSNVANLGLILGVTVVLGGARISDRSFTRNMAVGALAPAATAALAATGELGRPQAAALMAVFFAWLAATILDARRERSAVLTLAEKDLKRTVLSMGLGMLAMAGAGRLIVLGATAIAERWGVDVFVVGALIAAVGTSTPELAVSLVSRARGHDDVSIGTLLGSNVFNGLFIVPLVCLIAPTMLPWRELAPTLGFGLIVVALTHPGQARHLSRGRGLLLLSAYVGFVIALASGGSR